jgi:hypothetical protein
MPLNFVLLALQELQSVRGQLAADQSRCFKLEVFPSYFLFIFFFPILWVWSGGNYWNIHEELQSLSVDFSDMYHLIFHFWLKQPQDISSSVTQPRTEDKANIILCLHIREKKLCLVCHKITVQKKEIEQWPDKIFTFLLLW